MNRKKSNICEVHDYLKFQTSTRDLGMHPPWIRRDYCIRGKKALNGAIVSQCDNYYDRCKP